MLTETVHSIRLYFPYTFNSDSQPSKYIDFSNKLADLKINDLINQADFLNKNIHPNFLDSNLWQSQQCLFDKRIHEFGNKLVNGLEKDSTTAGFFGLSPVRLSDDAIRVLNCGTPSSLGAGLSIDLKKSAIQRLHDKGITPPLDGKSYPLMFNSVWFYSLNMGVGMMVIDVSFKQPQKGGIGISHLEEFQEINYMISRNSNDNQSATINWTSDKKTKGLSDIVDLLLPVGLGQSINLKTTKDHKNTYSYSYIATEHNLEYAERKNYLFRLSRKYNELYLPENTDQQIDYFEPFLPITHAFSLEGAASFIDYSAYDGSVPESIKSFHRSAIPQAYAILILLTYAEYIFLREMATNTPDTERVDMRNPTEKNLAKLRSFRTKLYDFRLNFRYSQISSNTNHNLFCDTNKKALEIERILLETSNDTKEIELYIADQVSQQQQKKLKVFGIIGSLFAVIIGWVDLWGLNFHQIIFEENTNNIPSIFIFIVVLIALCIMVISTSGIFSSSDNSESDDN